MCFVSRSEHVPAAHAADHIMLMALLLSAAIPQQVAMGTSTKRQSIGLICLLSMVVGSGSHIEKTEDRIMVPDRT